MVQGGSGACFTAKASQSLQVLGDVLREKRQGNKAAKLSVFGFVNYTHPATAEFLDDAVVRDGLADHWRESYVGETGQVNESRGVGDCSIIRGGFV
jgi:hypothetical protein